MVMNNLRGIIQSSQHLLSEDGYTYFIIPPSRLYKVGQRVTFTGLEPAGNVKQAVNIICTMPDVPPVPPKPVLDTVAPISVTAESTAKTLEQQANELRAVEATRRIRDFNY